MYGPSFFDLYSWLICKEVDWTIVRSDQHAAIIIC